MFFVGKKIIYLSIYDKDKKEAAAGYAKCMKEKETYRLEIFLQKLQDWKEDNYQVLLAGRDEEVPLGNVNIRCGMGSACFYLPFSEENLVINHKRRSFYDFWGLKICGKENKVILGQWREQADALTQMPQGEVQQTEMLHRAEMRQQAERVQQTEMPHRAEMIQQAEMIRKQEWVEDFAEDKWQQLLKTYPRVHPFGDERVFITLEPKDFVILHSSCQKLVNNSFLLHGFYNYRHIILGFCSGIGTGEECYLGVPGTYYEREKMVAVMFGFEGFECNGPVENGKFGYYMRKVEL